MNELRRVVSVRGAAVFVLLTALTVPTAAPALATRPLPVLARDNVIRANEPGSVVVSLPTTATLRTRMRSFHPDGPNPDIRIRGGGEFAGVVLRALEDDWPHGFIVAGRFPGPGLESGGPGLVNVLSVTGLERDERYAVLPAGRYELYLVGDGGPVRAEIRLHGLDGKTALRPAAPAAVDAHAPDELLDHQGAGALRSAGSTYSMPRDGIALAMIWVSYDAGDSIAYGDCMYRGRVPVPHATAFGPHCNAVQSAAGAAGGAHSYGTYPGGSPGERLFIVTRLRVGTQAGQGGERDYGAWVASSGRIDDWGVSALFLGY